MKTGLLACLMIGTLLAGGQATAQSSATPAYSAKPIRLIVPGAPGSPPDALARILGEPLTALDVPVVVENRPGGAGALAMEALAQAAPDGYTLGIAGSPYDPGAAFAPVTPLVRTANLLVVRPASQLQTLGDFVALAKARPGWLTYASAGNGSASHLASKRFKHHAEIEIRHVPYKGIPAGLAAVMGGQVDIGFAGAAAALPLVKSGELRSLYQLDDWYGMVAPAGTPPELAMKLAREIARVVTLAGTRERLAPLGLVPAEKHGPEALGALIRAERPRWTQIARDAGIRAE